MAKKAKPAAAKSATEKPASEKPAKTKAAVATKPAKVAAKPAKAAAAPVKAAARPAAKTSAAKPSAPRASKPKEVTPIAQLPLPLGNAPVAIPPSLSERYPSFDDAKNATIDTLLASIEAAEARLLEVKRTSSFDELEPLANGELHS